MVLWVFARYWRRYLGYHGYLRCWYRQYPANTSPIPRQYPESPGADEVTAGTLVPLISPILVIPMITQTDSWYPSQLPITQYPQYFTYLLSPAKHRSLPNTDNTQWYLWSPWYHQYSPLPPYSISSSPCTIPSFRVQEKKMQVCVLLK